MNHATYVGCFCKNEWLLSLNDIEGICGHSFDKNDEADIGRYYGELCGVPSPYIMLSSTAPAIRTPIHTPSAKTSATTSILIEALDKSSLPVLEVPQDNREATESW